jgi:hypothetical protein
MAKVVKLSKYAKKTVKPAPKGLGKAASAKAPTFKVSGAKSGANDIDHFIKTAGLDTRREKEIVNGWVTVPEGVKLPDNQQDRDMLARELLIKFQMSPRHPMVDLNNAYRKF